MTRQIIISPPNILPKTGQTISYMTGDDGALERGWNYGNRFKLDGRSLLYAVSEFAVHLNWFQYAGKYSSAQYFTVIGTLAYGSYLWWYCPNPELNEGFWVISAVLGTRGTKFYDRFVDSGVVNGIPPLDSHLGLYQGEGEGMSDLTIYAGLVLDKTSGLMWHRRPEKSGPNNAEYYWENIATAIAAINAASRGGFNDWTVPNIIELFDMLNNGTNNPAIYSDYFAITAAIYWSSTSQNGLSEYAKAVNFADGDVGHYCTTEAEGDPYSLILCRKYK